MSEENEIIVNGPKLPMPILGGSLADNLFPRLKEFPGDTILQTDGLTGENLTASEVLHKSILVAESLKANGLKPGDVVIILSQLIKNVQIATLGTIWQGCAVAPLDTAMKVVELKHMFNIYKPSFLFAENGKLAEEAEKANNELGITIPIVLLDDNEDSKFINFTKFIDVQVDINNYQPQPISDPSSEVAFIAASSGSTGLPKGVTLTHSSLNFQLTFWLMMKPLMPGAGLQIMQFYWVSGAMTILALTMLGLRRVILKSYNPLHILEAIDKYRLAFTIMSPAELAGVVQHPDFNKYDLSSLLTLTSLGAPLPKVVFEAAKKGFPNARVTNGYGMSEVGGGAVIGVPDRIDTVGSLFFEYSLKVVDINTGKSVGPNQEGELCFKSPGIMKGYYNNEEATKLAIDKDGWYHSGDLGYYSEEGLIFIVDRIKEFIKFRTWQVPPMELEAFILELEGVKDVGVAGIPNEQDIYHPMALVVRHPGATITEQDIIDHVADKLSDHKRLRAGVIFVDAIPYTGTGKIKRNALKELAKQLYSQRQR